MNQSSRLLDLYSSPLPSAPAWVGEGVLVKGGILLMGGPAKIGKSWLLINAGDQLARGQRLWGMWDVPEPVTTLYIDRELGIYGYHERVSQFYNALGSAPPPNLHFLSKPPGYFLDTNRGIALLEEQIKRTRAKVVILDPISRFLSGDENSNTDVNTLFTKLTELQATHEDLSLILSHHFGKAPKGEYAENYDPLDPYNFRGAGKWFDAPDTAITFARTSGIGEEWWRLKYRAIKRHGKEGPDSIFALRPGGLVTPAVEVAGAGAGGRRGWERR